MNLTNLLENENFVYFIKKKISMLKISCKILKITLNCFNNSITKQLMK